MSDEITKDFRVQGFAELEKALDELPKKIQKNIMRGALRAGLKPILSAARSGIHSVSGVLAKGLKVSTRIKDGAATATLNTAGKHGPFAHLVEFGTRAHFIKGAFGSALKMPDGSLVSTIDHPGSAAKPFMRPAFDSQAINAIQAVGDYIGARLTKEGIDTAPVLVEGDE
jgi:HK97 gp10 family phage protein